MLLAKFQNLGLLTLIYRFGIGYIALGGIKLYECDSSNVEHNRTRTAAESKYSRMA